MVDLHDIARDLNDGPVAEAAPLDAIYRRAATIRRRTHLLRVTVGALSVGIAVMVSFAVIPIARDDNRVGTAPGTGRSVRPLVGWPKTFVSTRVGPRGQGVVVAVSDARTGAQLRTLATIPSGETVTGAAIKSDGNVWVTLNRGPSLVGYTVGGGPIANSCASTLLEIEPRTGFKRTHPVGRDDELVSDVQPSPTGDRIAYLYGGCAMSFFNRSVRVEDVKTGRVVSIGAELPRCHDISGVRWTPDGDHLVLVYAVATTPNYQGAEGTCSTPGPGAIAVVSARKSQGVINGTTTDADAGCSIDAVTVTKRGYAAIEHCGEPSFIGGPVHLVRYDTKLRPVTRTALGQCENGASIAGTTRSDAVIISTYQFCNPGDEDPVTRVFVDDGARLRTLLSLPGGYTAVDHIAF